MKPIRKTRHALMFMGAGAVAAYFLDPEAGPERRERLMQQVQSLTGQMGGTGSGDSGGSRDQGAAEPSSSSSGSSAAAEPFAASSGSSGSSAGSSSSTSAGERSDTASGPIDLATGEPLSGSST